MRVLNYLELAGQLERSGIGTSARNQHKALADTEICLVTTPWKGGSVRSASVRRTVGAEFFESYDVAHCNVIGPGSVAVAGHARRNDIPLILHSHVTAEDFGESFRFSSTVAPALRRYLRWFYSQADLILCPSKYTKSNLESYPVRAPVRSISNGVDTERLVGHGEVREEYRVRYELDGMVVFAVGNVFERKGLTAFCEVAEATDYDFVWFGPYDSGPQATPTVKRLTRDPPANVTFTGWIQDIRGGFGAGDVYLFPTKDENQGIAVLEAMACGKAVVLSDIDVFQEFYTDGEDCLMCSTHQEYIEALDRLAADPELRHQLGENAKETAAKHTLDRLGDDLVKAYQDVLVGAV
jgi:glycosyltransferase involved in cell wall biosynthesis